jgi:1-deoxy-D-xylulose-5-phosphate reductoisomerase
MFVYIEEANEILLENSISEGSLSVLNGKAELKELLNDPNVDVIISAISGFAGLETTLMAAKTGKVILLANKESIVVAGDIILPLAKEHGSTIIPIDSEHNAIFQCLDSEKNTNDVSKIIITASGGPFEGKKLLDLKDVTKKEALNHPNWDMGSKISIDSATLVNKCLELIEARYLFDLNEKYFELVIHPQSIIHSIVTYIDGSSLCHMSNPDMKVPISHALSDSNRLPINFLEIDFSSLELSFKNFPSDRKNLENIAREICNVGGSSGTIFNAANEIAVQDFLLNKIKFNDIYEVIYRTFDAITVSNNLNVEAIYEIDHQARMEAEKMVKSIT